MKKSVSWIFTSRKTGKSWKKLEKFIYFRTFTYHTIYLANTTKNIEKLILE